MVVLFLESVISSDGMIKEQKRKQFNLHIHVGKVYHKVSPDLKTKQRNHHVKPSLDI